MRYVHALYTKHLKGTHKLRVCVSFLKTSLVMAATYTVLLV